MTSHSSASSATSRVSNSARITSPSYAIRTAGSPTSADRSAQDCTTPRGAPVQLLQDEHGRCRKLGERHSGLPSSPWRFADDPRAGQVLQTTPRDASRPGERARSADRRSRNHAGSGNMRCLAAAAKVVVYRVPWTTSRGCCAGHHDQDRDRRLRSVEGPALPSR